jgi:hypothetical protein
MQIRPIIIKFNLEFALSFNLEYNGIPKNLLFNFYDHLKSHLRLALWHINWSYPQNLNYIKRFSYLNNLKAMNKSIT